MSAMSDGSSEDEYVQTKSNSSSDSEARYTTRSISGLADEHLSSRHDVPKPVSADVERESTDKIGPWGHVKSGGEVTRHRSKGKKAVLPQAFNTGYRELLNSVIEETREHPTSRYGSEQSSHIGASFWSADEKELFFQALASKGIGDLAAISASIGSKDEAEVQAYILLFQESLDSARLRSPLKSSITYADIDATNEVSADCELVLSAAADDLAHAVEARDILIEKRASGGDWLIDDDAADQIEAQYHEVQQHLEGDPSPESRPDIQTSGSAATPNNDVHSNPASLTDTTIPPVLGHALTVSETLLRPATFLTLSRDLFMNSQGDHEQNWRLIQPIGDAADSPALFRSAFDEFHNLAVSLTRRLVQASIIQATSRLRAEDALRSNFTPAPLVREVDVRSAADVLGLQADWKRFWATAPRRCRVEVFSREKQYNDGRPSTKVGFSLDYHEVEAALGFGKGFAAEHGPVAAAEGDEVQDEDVWAAVNDDFLDLLTEEELSDEDGEGVVGKEPLRDADELADVRPGAQSAAKTGRKRKATAEHEARLENKRLEALDQNASLDEERKLWEAMGMLPPERLQVPQHHTSYAELPPISCENAVRSWRTRTNYQAAWEQPQSPIPPESFEEMDARGCKARQHRIKLYDRIRERLQSQDTSADNEELLEQQEIETDVSDDAKPVTMSGSTSDSD